LTRAKLSGKLVSLQIYDLVHVPSGTHAELVDMAVVDNTNITSAFLSLCFQQIEKVRTYHTSFEPPSFDYARASSFELYRRMLEENAFSFEYTSSRPPLFSVVQASQSSGA
jgi:hypothetical protein